MEQGSYCSSDDVWAAGQQLGSQAPDQGLIEHWNGRTWSVVATPASATASVLFDAVTATASQAWLVGESDSPAGGGRPPIESYAAGTWSVASLPASAGSDWTNLYGLAQADGSVWAAGTYVDPSTDNNNALVLRETDGTWTVDNAPDPGSGSNIPGGITAVGGQLWLAGMYDNGGSELPLIEHR